MASIVVCVCSHGFLLGCDHLNHGLRLEFDFILRLWLLSLCLCLHGWLSHQNCLPSVAVALGSADCCGGGSCSHAGSCAVIMMAPGKAAGCLMAFLLLLWRTWEEVGLVRSSVEQGWMESCAIFYAACVWLLLLHGGFYSCIASTVVVCH